jgi:SAF domain-containing protein
MSETVEPRASADGVNATAIVFDGVDLVAVVTSDVEAGTVVDAAGDLIVARESIPAGHKIARVGVRAGELVLKYGQPIGRATRDIVRGSHVHVQNLESARLPGPTGWQR